MNDMSSVSINTATQHMPTIQGKYLDDCVKDGCIKDYAGEVYATPVFLAAHGDAPPAYTAVPVGVPVTSATPAPTRSGLDRCMHYLSKPTPKSGAWKRFDDTIDKWDLAVREFVFGEP